MIYLTVIHIMLAKRSVNVVLHILVTTLIHYLVQKEWDPVYPSFIIVLLLNNLC